jgi:hypothetical protein
LFNFRFGEDGLNSVSRGQLKMLLFLPGVERKYRIFRIQIYAFPVIAFRICVLG